MTTTAPEDASMAREIALLVTILGLAGATWLVLASL